MTNDVKDWPPLEEILPNVELVAEDGVPMESGWHLFCMTLLIDVIESHLSGRDDFFAAGNQFIYFSVEQARNRDFRGPDFYVVLDVPREPLRQYWCVWEEGGRYPNVIVELLSPSTAKLDRTVKKNVYEKTFRTPDYFCYDPDKQKLEGWRLDKGRYRRLKANDRGWLWCAELELWLGIWHGKYKGYEQTWLRFYDREGKLIPTAEEAAQAEVAKLRARLAELENRD